MGIGTRATVNMNLSGCLPTLQYWGPVLRGLAVCVFVATANVISIAATAATAPIAGPQVTAEQIRAAHPGAAPALKLVFDRVETGGRRAPPQPGKHRVPSPPL